MGNELICKLSQPKSFCFGYYNTTYINGASKTFILSICSIDGIYIVFLICFIAFIFLACMLFGLHLVTDFLGAANALNFSAA